MEGNSAFPKAPAFLDLIIRLFCVVSSTLVGRILPFWREAMEHSRAIANWVIILSDVVRTETTIHVIVFFMFRRIFFFFFFCKIHVFVLSFVIISFLSGLLDGKSNRDFFLIFFFLIYAKSAYLIKIQWYVSIRKYQKKCWFPFSMIYCFCSCQHNLILVFFISFSLDSYLLLFTFAKFAYNVRKSFSPVIKKIYTCYPVAFHQAIYIWRLDKQIDR